MNEILINTFLYIGYLACLVFLIWGIYVSLISLKAIFSNRKWFASQILDNAIETKLSTTTIEDLEKWFDGLREKHRKVNKIKNNKG